jgi:hypothetical protein
LYAGYLHIIAQSASALSQREDEGTIAYIFDEIHSTQFQELLQAFREAKTLYNDIKPIRDRLGDEPQMRDDKLVVPLQAADLWAGLVRWAAEDALSWIPGEYPLARKWLGSMKIPNRAFYWDDKNIEGFFDRAKENNPKFGTEYESAKQRSKRLKRLRKISSQNE